MDDPSATRGMCHGALSVQPVAGMAAEGNLRAGQDASLNGLVVAAGVADQAAATTGHGVGVVGRAMELIEVRRLENTRGREVAATVVGAARGRRPLARAGGPAALAKGREHLAPQDGAVSDRVVHGMEVRAADARGAAMSALLSSTC